LLAQDPQYISLLPAVTLTQHVCLPQGASDGSMSALVPFPKESFLPDAILVFLFNVKFAESPVCPISILIAGVVD
jgi:hypothetical protein